MSVCECMNECTSEQFQISQRGIQHKALLLILHYLAYLSGVFGSGNRNSNIPQDCMYSVLVYTIHLKIVCILTVHTVINRIYTWFMVIYIVPDLPFFGFDSAS